MVLLSAQAKRTATSPTAGVGSALGSLPPMEEGAGWGQRSPKAGGHSGLREVG